jgi:hypothetical protein
MKNATAAGLMMTGVLVAVVSLGCEATDPAPAHRAATGSQGAAVVDPADFTHPRANAYFPLRPGLVTTLQGSEDGEHFRERVEVTGRTKLIQGVRTIAATDVVHRNDGVLAEETTDFYAADNNGNVWYFGEDTATYDDSGRLESREGTWRAGSRGAVVGMVMPADPGPTDAYRQEFWRGHAEDQGWIVDRNGHTTVPAGSYEHVLRGYEWSRLEPGVVAMKLYAPGIGIVKEKDVAGGNEMFSLVSVTRNH